MASKLFRSHFVIFFHNHEDVCEVCSVFICCSRGFLVSTGNFCQQILDSDKVQKWHKALQRTMEEETRLANLYWLELLLPSK